MTPRSPAGSEKTRRARRAGAGRREDVLGAVIRVVADRGLDSTRFTDVARTVGVAVSTLQYWFGSREDMLVQAFLYMHRRDVARVEDVIRDEVDPWQRLVRLVRFDLCLTDDPVTVDRRAWIEFWRAAIRDEELRAESRRAYAWWREPFRAAIVEGTERGLFRPAMPIDAIVTDIVASLDGVSVPLLLDHSYFDAHTFADTLLARVAVPLSYGGSSERADELDRRAGRSEHPQRSDATPRTEGGDPGIASDEG